MKHLQRLVAVAAPVVEVARAHREAEHLQVEQKLALVIDEVLQVPQQERQHRFPTGDKDGRYLPGKIGVREQRETFLDVGHVFAHPQARLFDAAAVIHRQLAQAEEVLEASGIGGIVGGAETGQAIEQVPQKLVQISRMIKLGRLIRIQRSCEAQIALTAGPT